MDMLTHRPLLRQERVRARFEMLVEVREEVREVLQESPASRVDSQVVRRPKAKRVKPEPAMIVYRREAA